MIRARNWAISDGPNTIYCMERSIEGVGSVRYGVMVGPYESRQTAAWRLREARRRLAIEGSRALSTQISIS